ncbi:MAG TPA: class I SAM-dependent methyltransferase [Longimicrobiales bacterium]|nr:class I SAM-dependent methyltransferase [Longimicrobiales bacterium]
MSTGSSRSVPFSHVAGAFHDAWARQNRDPALRFLNYGFWESGDGDGTWLDPPDRPDRLHFNLIRRLTEAADLRGKVILEVSSGRGGNCHYLVRYAGARRVVGVDRCAGSVELAGRSVGSSSAAFLVGLAEALPFEARSFDAVVNLEAAHCYHDFPGFLAEVRRVLKPGGLFLFADVWGAALRGIDWPARRAALASAGLEEVRSEALGPGVRRALEREAEGVYRSAGVVGPGGGTVLGLRIAEMARELRTQLAAGVCTYPLWHLRKPDEAGQP